MTYKRMQQHAHWDKDALYWVDNKDPDMVWIWTGSMAAWQVITRELAEDFDPVQKPPKEAHLANREP